MKERKIGRRILIVFLAIQALMELGIGATLLVDFPTALESGFGITYSSELDILGVALGLYLLLLTCLLVLSIMWISKGNYSGITLGIIIGIFLFVFGVVSFLKFDQTQALLVDSLRGLLTITLSYIAYKELKNKEQHT